MKNQSKGSASISKHIKYTKLTRTGSERLAKLATIALILLTTLPASSNQATLRCLNERRQEVSWFIALRLKGTVTPREYIVMDNLRPTWRVTTEKVLMGGLLYQVNVKRSQVIAWSDQPPQQSLTKGQLKQGESPEDPKFNHASAHHFGFKQNLKQGWKITAHSKGLLTYNNQLNQGFLLSHSIPQYPVLRPDGSFDPVSRKSSKYGQHVVCVTLRYGYKQFARIAKQLDTSSPDYYYQGFDINKQSRRRNLGLFDYLNRKGYQKRCRHRKKFKKASKPLMATSSPTLRGMPPYQKVSSFTFVTKTDKMIVPVFSGFLIPFLNAININTKGLIVETWGRPLKPSNCYLKDTVVNVRRLSYDNRYFWTEGSDHAKWAISNDILTGLVCLGDLNHMTSQAKRGGSFLCIQHKMVYKGFMDLIKERDWCV